MAATDLERLLVQLEAQSTKLDKALSGVVGNVDRQLDRVEKRTDLMNQRVTAGFGRAGVAIAGFFSARAVIGFISRVSDAADKLQALADRTGVGTEELQRLAGAAAKANVDTENLNDALEVFARNVGRASEGQGDLAKLFKELGIVAGDDLIGTLLKVADAVKDAKTRSEEYRITTIALGKANVELVGFMNQGKDAIEAQTKAFNDVVSADAVRSLAEFNQHWKEIEVSLRNMGAGPAAFVLEGLSDFLKDLEQGTWPQRLQALASFFSGGIVPQPLVQLEDKINAVGNALDVATDKVIRMNAAMADAPNFFTKEEIAAAADEMVRLQHELAALVKQRPPSVTAPAAKPFGAPAGESDSDVAARAKTEQRLRLDTLEKLEELTRQSFQRESDFRNEQFAQELEDRQRAADNVFDAEQEQHQRLLDERLDFNERMQAAIDAADVRAAENRQRQMDEDAEAARTLNERKLDAAQEFFGNLASLTQSSNETLHAIGKAAAIAEATINGVRAVMNALATPLPWPIPQALAVSAGAAAAVQIAKLAAMREGGIVGPDGPMKLQRYARGGVASSPQMAIFGEGATPEAFVPLQDGRSIPVTLKLPELPPASSAGSRSLTLHIDARGAQEGVAEQIKSALQPFWSQYQSDQRQFARRLPDLMATAQRRKL